MLPLQQSTAFADYVHRRNSVTFSRGVPVTVPIPDSTNIIKVVRPYSWLYRGERERARKRKLLQQQQKLS